jgi:hypothetical protein
VALIKHKVVVYQFDRFLESLNAHFKGQLPAAPRTPVAGDGSGSVLLYGPYDLPK